MIKYESKARGYPSPDPVGIITTAIQAALDFTETTTGAEMRGRPLYRGHLQENGAFSLQVVLILGLPAKQA